MSDSIELVSRAVDAVPGGRRGLVAIDGRDGAGKTTFADALAARLSRPSVRASIDDFHYPRAVRYRRGRESPEGFYRDSYDLDALTRELLEPFAAGQRFRRRWFDHRADQRVAAAKEDAAPEAVLIVDGLFLHRRELRDRWDVSVFLDVSPGVAAERLLGRDGGAPRDRYQRGQELYLADAQPTKPATLVVPW